MKPHHLLAVLTAYFLLAVSGISHAAPKDTLIFGAVSTCKVSQVKKSLAPLLHYLEQETGTKILFETGRDYPDTINKFQSGYFDLGYIGPSPYVIATSGEFGPEIFQIIAGLETEHRPYFHGVIIAAKNNGDITKLSDIAGKRFAFGSRQSTLSFYMPCKMLLDHGILKTLTEHRFLGKHDKVARDVAMGRFEAGGIKEAVAVQHQDKIKIIARSEPVYDFLLVAHKHMDSNQYKTIKEAVLQLQDPEILGAIKEGVTGFIETSDRNYDNLRKTMRDVDKRFKN